MTYQGTLKGAATSLVAVAVLGLAACGGGGGDSGPAPGPDPDPLPAEYSAIDERPAAATAAVGSSVEALSSSIGIGGAARISGSIPAPASLAPMARRSALSSPVSYTGEEEAARKRLAVSGKAPRIASTTDNFNLIQGGWVDTFEPSELDGGYYFDGETRYSVNLASPCTEFDVNQSSVTTTTTLEESVDAIDADSMTLFDSSWVRASTENNDAMEQCITEAGFTLSTEDGGGEPPTFESGVGQVSFSDNSTFSYSFSSSSAPTAVFVQLDGADEYFVVPFSALTANGDGTYSFNFFGPTPGGSVDQVINVVISGTITIQVFYGDATPEELLETDFPGVEDESNWSPPAYVDCVAQPTLSGALQATLTWNTTADLDLYVEEPDGTIIYYGSDFVGTGADPSPAGGTLDVDDTNGYGPENIFYANTPSASGTYQIWVDHFSGASPSSYTLTITRDGVPQTYTGTLSSNGSSTPINVTIP